MPAQVLRIRTVKDLPSRLAAHVRGEPGARPPEAVPRVEWVRLHAHRLGGDPGAAEKAVDEARAVKRRGRPGHACIDVLIAGAPGFESPDRWDDGKVLRWSRDSAAWLQHMCGPDAVVHSAALHLDEKSPHVHALVVPAVRDKNGGVQLSWSAVRKRGAERITGGPIRGSGRPRRGTHGPEMSAWQDSYHTEVGSKYGLGRGERGSTRRHVEPDSRRGLEDRFRDAEHRTQEAEQRAQEAEQRAQERVATADRAVAEARRAEAAERGRRSHAQAKRKAAERTAAAVMSRAGVPVADRTRAAVRGRSPERGGRGR